MTAIHRPGKETQLEPEDDAPLRRGSGPSRILADRHEPRSQYGHDLSALVRFRDPDTGKTWNGFGRPPNWIRGQDRSRFRVG